MVFSYVLGWKLLSLYFGLCFIQLLHLIASIGDIYHIKSCSVINNDVLHIVLCSICSLILFIKNCITIFMWPLIVLKAAISLKIKDIMISRFTSSLLYKTLKIIYYEYGLFTVLYNLALFIFYKTREYVKINLWNIIVLQFFCISQICLGGEATNFWLVVWLFYTIIHLPFFIISIARYITIIDRNFYKKHPVLFWLYTFTCVLLLIVFILSLVMFYRLISDLISCYFVQTKSTEGSDGSGPESGPGSNGWGGFRTRI